MNPVRLAFKSNPAPRPVVCDLVHFPPDLSDPDAPEYWTIRLYRDDFDSYSAEDRLVIFNWVSALITKMREHTPNVYVEVFERTPHYEATQ